MKMISGKAKNLSITNEGYYWKLQKAVAFETYSDM